MLLNSKGEAIDLNEIKDSSRNFCSKKYGPESIEARKTYILLYDSLTLAMCYAENLDEVCEKYGDYNNLREFIKFLKKNNDLNSFKIEHYYRQNRKEIKRFFK